MANAYAAATFVVDTDTTITGLEALKGSALALTDYICVPQGTLTVDKSFSCAQINIGFGAKNGASQTTTVARLSAGDVPAIITIVDGGQLNNSPSGILGIHGTLVTIANGTGAADQIVPLLHTDNDALQVSGVWWRYLPYLTGRSVDVASSSSGTVVTVASDPRVTRLYYGCTVELRDRATGVLAGTGTLTAYSATTITLNAAVPVTSAMSVYLPIAADEHVYTTDGSGNAVFGGGHISAYNDNGGACPVGPITSPSVTIRASGTATGVCWQNVSGTVSVAGCCLTRNRPSTNWWGTHVWLSASPRFESCAFSRSIAHGIYLAFGVTDATVSGNTVQGCAGVGIYLAYGVTDATVSGNTVQGCAGVGIWLGSGVTDATVSGNTVQGNASYGIWLGSGVTDATVSGNTVQGSAGYGIYLAFGVTDATVSGNTVQGNASYGIIAERGCRNVVVSSDNRAFGNGSNPQAWATNMSFGANPVCYRTAATGTAATLYHRFAAADTGDIEALDPLGNSIAFRLPNAWYTTPPLHVPGLAAWGATSLDYTANGGELDVQYRVSHDYGRTYTAWADLPASITDTPDAYGECIQFRIQRTNAAGTGDPELRAVSVTCTAINGWTRPASWDGVHDILAAMRPKLVYQGGAQPWS